MTSSFINYVNVIQRGSFNKKDVKFLLRYFYHLKTEALPGGNVFPYSVAKSLYSP